MSTESDPASAPIPFPANTPGAPAAPTSAEETEVVPLPMPQAPRVIALVGEMSFSGAVVTRVLLEDGFTVRALCPDPAAEEALKQNVPSGAIGKLECIRGNLDSTVSIAETLKGAWGAAFLSPLSMNGRMYRSAEHLEDVRRFCEALQSSDTARVLYHSQLSAHPVSPSISLQQSAAAEEMVHALNRQVFRFRTGILMGSGDHFQSDYSRKARKGSLFMGILGYGSTNVQPLHIKDMAQCVARIFSDDPKPLTAGLYSVAGPEITTPLDMIDMALLKAGRFKIKFHAPLFVLKLLAGAGGSQAFKEKVTLLFEGFCTDRNDSARLLGPLYRLTTPQQSLDTLSADAA